MCVHVLHIYVCIVVCTNIFVGLCVNICFYRGITPNSLNLSITVSENNCRFWIKTFCKFKTTELSFPCSHEYLSAVTPKQSTTAVTPIQSVNAVTSGQSLHESHRSNFKSINKPQSDHKKTRLCLSWRGILSKIKFRVTLNLNLKSSKFEGEVLSTYS